VDKPLADREFLPLVKSEMKKHSDGVFFLLQEELNLGFSKVVELLGGAEEFRREYKFPNESVLTFLYRSNNDEEFNYFSCFLIFMKGISINR
jgi:hypothetical protein